MVSLQVALRDDHVVVHRRQELGADQDATRGRPPRTRTCTGWNSSPMFTFWMLRAELPHQGVEEVLLLLDRLGVEQGEVLLGPALPLQVDGQQVGPAGDEEPDDLAAVLGVAHEARRSGRRCGCEVPESPSWLRSPRKASASSIITPTGAMALRMFSTFSRLALGDALPLGAEVAELDDGDADLAREGGDHEALARAHRARDQVAHGQHVQAALADGLGRAAEALLHEVVPRDDGQVVLALDELQQARRPRSR